MPFPPWSMTCADCESKQLIGDDGMPRDEAMYLGWTKSTGVGKSEWRCPNCSKKKEK